MNEPFKDKCKNNLYETVTLVKKINMNKLIQNLINYKDNEEIKELFYDKIICNPVRFGSLTSDYISSIESYINIIKLILYSLNKIIENKVNRNYTKYVNDVYKYMNKLHIKRTSVSNTFNQIKSKNEMNETIEYFFGTLLRIFNNDLKTIKKIQEYPEPNQQNLLNLINRYHGSSQSQDDSSSQSASSGGSKKKRRSKKRRNNYSRRNKKV